MKNRKFEIAVAGYPSYRFKTYAYDDVEASVKIKCFLRKPDACISSRGNRPVRETKPHNILLIACAIP